MGRRFGHGELHLVLLALLSVRPMHGYELMGELAARMGRRYRPSPGSIYPAIRSLEAEGLIDATDDDPRTYGLTTEGHAALERRADRLAGIEARLGVRFAADDSLEGVLERSMARLRVVAALRDVERVAEVLEEAVEAIRSLPGRRDR